MENAFIKNHFEPVQARLAQVSDEFPWENKEAYLGWLAQTYEYVLHSTRMLSLTAAKIPMHLTQLSNRFIAHAAEEKNHDKLLKNDAKVLGQEIEKIPVLAEAEAFHKSFYYWIHEGQPLTILGLLLCLEGYAAKCGAPVYARIAKAHGEKASSFIKVHGEEDQDHILKAVKALDGLNPEEYAQVVHGYYLYADLYANVLKAVARKCQEQNTPTQSRTAA